MALVRSHHASLLSLPRSLAALHRPSPPLRQNASQRSRLLSTTSCTSAVDSYTPNSPGTPNAPKNRTDTSDVPPKPNHAHNYEHENVTEAKAHARGLGEGGEGERSQAASGREHGDVNARAKQDHPEAPGPVLGMNDERGGVSLCWRLHI